jgi:hypothetical protein
VLAQGHLVHCHNQLVGTIIIKGRVEIDDDLRGRHFYRSAKDLCQIGQRDSIVIAAIETQRSGVAEIDNPVHGVGVGLCIIPLVGKAGDVASLRHLKSLIHRLAIALRAWRGRTLAVDGSSADGNNGLLCKGMKASGGQQQNRG